jgi:hypothetical protein
MNSLDQELVELHWAVFKHRITLFMQLLIAVEKSTDKRWRFKRQNSSID